MGCADCHISLVDERGLKKAWYQADHGEVCLSCWLNNGHFQRRSARVYGNPAPSAKEDK